MGRWWFVRHGESVANAEGWLAGHRDVALTPLGVEQARALHPELAALRPDRVLTSDLRRASHTAALAWNHRLPPPSVVPALRERHGGAWEGQALARLRETGAMDVMVSWEGSPPGGESQRALALRALDGLRAADDGGDALVFAHGGLIRCVVGLLDELPFEAIGLTKVGNTQVLARDVPPGTWDRLTERVRRG